MYRFTVKETKTKPITEAKDFVNLVGELYFLNHKWRVSVEKSSMQLPIKKNSVIPGTELIKIIDSGVKFQKATFCALEGDQIAFMLTCEDDDFTIHAIQVRWLEFFTEKCKITDVQELDNDLPEFRDFMQD